MNETRSSWGTGRPRGRRFWILIAAFAIVVIGGAVWLAKGPWRGSPLAPSRYSPLAAELEGVRGVYLYYGLPGSDSLVAEYRALS